ncbi:MAG: hypothetical protein Q8M16_01035 [Pirellulaceae bacterium]|nr:hypothetical protein [Pirellulaceae bacterium]
MRKRLPGYRTIRESWQLVYQFYWDSGYPRPEINVAQVFQQDGVYVVLERPCAKAQGPYSSLSEALEVHGFLCVNGITVEIVCTVMDAKQLSKLLYCDESVGFKLKINGEQFQLTPARIFGRSRKLSASNGEGSLDSKSVNAESELPSAVNALG